MTQIVHPKLRRALVCTALVSALSLLPLGDAAAAQPHSTRTGAVDLSASLAGRSLWDVLTGLLGQWSPRAGRGGNKASVRIDPNGSMLSGSTDLDGGNKASVRIDPNGNS